MMSNPQFRFGYPFKMGDYQPQLLSNIVSYLNPNSSRKDVNANAIPKSV
jgi:hypothetical protein